MLPKVPTGTKPPPLPGWLKIVQRHVFADVYNLVNIHWMAFDATEAESADITDLNDLDMQIADAWLATISHFIDASAVLTEQQLVLFRASGELAGSYNWDYSGTLTGTSLTPTECVQANWTIDAYYRGGHPKTFFPPATESHLLQAAQWAPALLVSAAGYLATWISTLNAVTTTHLTIPGTYIAPSWATHNAYRTTAVQHNIRGVVMQQRIGAQRRRRGKPIS